MQMKTHLQKEEKIYLMPTFKHLTYGRKSLQQFSRSLSLPYHFICLSSAVTFCMTGFKTDSYYIHYRRSIWLPTDS